MTVDPDLLYFSVASHLSPQSKSEAEGCHFDSTDEIETEWPSGKRTSVVLLRHGRGFRVDMYTSEGTNSKGMSTSVLYF